MGVFPLIAACFALTLAAGEIVSPKRSDKNTVSFLLYLLLGIALMHGYLLFDGRMHLFPHLYRIHVPQIYALGPLLLGYLVVAIHGSIPRSKRLFWHFIPALGAFVICLPLFVQSASEKKAAVKALLQNGQGDYGTLVFAGGLLHFVLYASVGIFMTVRRLPPANLLTQKPVLIVIGLGAYSLAITIATLATLGFRNINGITMTMNMLATIPFLIYLLGRRYPHFFFDLAVATNPERYRTSQLGRVDLDAVKAKLAQLMGEEKLYEQESLTLPELASRLDLSAHQLSEFFNNELGLGFSAYVNSQRVSAAAKLLLEDPERTVLSIAYEVGFNSKSSFNQAFAKKMGQTPSAFRKQRR